MQPYNAMNSTNEQNTERQSRQMNSLADLPALLTVEEAGEIMRLGRSAMYQAVRVGEIPGVIRIGRSIRISRARLEHLLGVHQDVEPVASGLEVTTCAGASGDETQA